jgi:hypothetical protein
VLSWYNESRKTSPVSSHPGGGPFDGLRTRCPESKKKDQSASTDPWMKANWRPQPDLNRCRRRERPVSWTWLDDGDAVVANEWSPSGMSPKIGPKVNPN